MDQQRAQIAISTLLMPNSLARPPPNRCFGQLTEVGVIAAQAPGQARELIDACDETIPVEACEALTEFVHQIHRPDEAIARLDRTITNDGSEG